MKEKSGSVTMSRSMEGEKKERVPVKGCPGCGFEMTIGDWEWCPVCGAMKGEFEDL